MVSATTIRRTRSTSFEYSRKIICQVPIKCLFWKTMLRITVTSSFLLIVSKVLGKYASLRDSNLSSWVETRHGGPQFQCKSFKFNKAIKSVIRLLSVPPINGLVTPWDIECLTKTVYLGWVIFRHAPLASYRSCYWCLYQGPLLMNGLISIRVLIMQG